MSPGEQLRATQIVVVGVCMPAEPFHPMTAVVKELQPQAFVDLRDPEAHAKIIVVP